MECWQQPQTDYCGKDGRDAACSENLLQLTDTRVSPEPAVHPEVVKNKESDQPGDEHVWHDQSQILANPPKILEPDSKRYERRCQKRHSIQEEEMPVSHPVRE